jgi:transcriptional regulator with XRE-family HTH domain
MAKGSYSDMLLTRVREGMKSRGLNRAAFAKRLGVDRRELRAVLAGKAPLTVDQFFAMVEALELSPLELGLPADLAGLAEEAEAEAEAEAAAPELPVEEAPQPDPVLPPQLALADGEPEPEPVLVDPDGPQAAEILRLGFALGIDMTFGCATDEVRESGVPEVVLSRFPELLPIRMDAAYHHANRAQYLEEGLVLRLSFDRVRTCLFPWSAIRHVTLFPEPPLEPEGLEEPPPEPEPGVGPALRLVKS